MKKNGWFKKCTNCGKEFYTIPSRNQNKCSLSCRDVDVTGNTYGKLTALRFDKSIGTRYFWIFRCECGKEKSLIKYNVVSGKTKSCGCLLLSNCWRGYKTQPLFGTKFYHTYFRMVQRCNNTHHPRYAG